LLDRALRCNLAGFASPCTSTCPGNHASYDTTPRSRTRRPPVRRHALPGARAGTAARRQHHGPARRLPGAPVSDDRALARRPRDGSGRRAQRAQRVLHGRLGRRRVEDGRLRHHLAADLGRLLRDGLDRRHPRGRLRPERHLCGHRLGRHPQQRHPGSRRLQVRRRRQDVAVHRPQGRGPDRRGADPPHGSRHRLHRRPGERLRPQRRPRGLPHDRRRQDVAEGAVHLRLDRMHRPGVRAGQPQGDLRRHVARPAQAVDHHLGRPGGRHLQVHRRRRHVDEAHHRAAAGIVRRSRPPTRIASTP